MNILEKIQKLINNCKGKSIKKIRQNLDIASYDEQIKKVIQFVYSGNRDDKIDSQILKRYYELVQMNFEDLTTIIQKIQKKQLVGRELISVINGLINSNINNCDIIYKIFDGDLQIEKISKKQICKIFKIKFYNYQFEQNEGIKYDQSYLLQKYCEGITTIYKIWYNQYKNKTQIKRFTSDGIQIEGVDNNIENELLDYYSKSKYFKQNIVFIGNLYLKNNEQLKIKQLKKKRVNINLKYQIYDFMLLDEYLQKIQIKTYLWRRDKMIRLFFGYNGKQKFNYLDILFSSNYSQQKLKLLIQRYIDTGIWNGIIFKNNSYKVLYKYIKYQNSKFGIVKDINIDSKIVEDKEKGKYQVKYVSSIKVKIDQNNIIDVSNGIIQENRYSWYFNPSQIIGKEVQIKISKDNKQYLYKGEKK